MTNSLKIITIFFIPAIFSKLLEIDMTSEKLEPNLPVGENMTLFSSIFPFDLSVLEQNVLTLKICIGSGDPQCFKVIYDTGSFHLWVTGTYSSGCHSCKHFDYFDSTTFFNTYEEIVLQYVTGEATGNHVKDLVAVSDQNMTLTALDWMLAKNVKFNVKGADGIIGFARDYESDWWSSRQADKNFSIMDRLKLTQAIEEKVFSQKYTNEEKTQAKLFIGGKHEDFINVDLNNTSLSSCKVRTSDPLFAAHSVKDMWTCRLSHIILGDNSPAAFKLNSIEIYERAVIDSGTNFINAPYNYFEIFAPYFLNQTNCNYQYTEGIKVFYCDSDFDYNKMPKVSFVFNGIAYYIPNEYLFKNVEGQLVFVTFFQSNLDFWLIGQAFMKIFHILFDHDNDVITFSAPIEYTSDVSMYTSDDDFVFSDYLLWFILLICFVVVVVAIILFFVCRKKTSVASSSYALFRNEPQIQTQTQFSSTQVNVGYKSNNQYNNNQNNYMNQPSGYAYPGTNRGNYNQNSNQMNINTF